MPPVNPDRIAFDHWRSEEEEGDFRRAWLVTPTALPWEQTQTSQTPGACASRELNLEFSGAGGSAWRRTARRLGLEVSTLRD